MTVERFELQRPKERIGIKKNYESHESLRIDSRRFVVFPSELPYQGFQDILGIQYRGIGRSRSQRYCIKTESMILQNPYAITFIFQSFISIHGPPWHGTAVLILLPNHSTSEQPVNYRRLPLPRRKCAPLILKSRCSRRYRVALRRVRCRAPWTFSCAANATYTQSDVRACGPRRGYMGVGCVKTLALTWQMISEPLGVERNTSNPSGNAE